jgi:hypothetical protein
MHTCADNFKVMIKECSQLFGPELPRLSHKTAFNEIKTIMNNELVHFTKIHLNSNRVRKMIIKANMHLVNIIKADKRFIIYTSEENSIVPSK